jgi:glycine hydroxymethyltransferase
MSYRVVFYGVDRKTEQIDCEAVRRLALKARPRLILAGASSYSRAIDFERFAEIAREVGAYFMVDMAHICGLVAAGLHPNPVPHADVVTTTTHKTLRGPRGGMILCKKHFADAIDSLVFPGTQGGPLMHQIAAKAVALREAMREEFVQYQRQIVANATCMAEDLRRRGYRIVAGGTDNHLFLVDLRDRGITGKTGALYLAKVNIILNKNMIPFDPQPPKITSGLRIGTPVVTSRGMKEPEMLQICELMDRLLCDHENKSLRKEIRKEVAMLVERFPLPGDLMPCGKTRTASISRTGL